MCAHPLAHSCLRDIFQKYNIICFKLYLWCLSFTSVHIEMIRMPVCGEINFILCSVRIVGDALRSSIENKPRDARRDMRVLGRIFTKKYFSFKQWYSYESSRYGE